MSKEPEITRTVAVEHAGEKIQIEVHVHLSQEEIRNILVPAVMDAIGAQLRRSTGYRLVSSGTTAPAPGHIRLSEPTV